MSSQPGIPIQSTRPISRAAQREQAARVTADEPTETPQAAAARPASRAARSTNAPASTKLTAKKGPVKVPLNTRVLASTESRLNWFTKNNGFAVTDVVDVALQELFDRNDVPQAGPDGTIAADL